MFSRDEGYMSEALNLARQAGEAGEVPVGALLVHNDTVLARAWNQPITVNDPTAHAEMLVLRKAASQLENYRLLGTTLYVTLEPCPMCAGAMVHARVSRLVFGAVDTRGGAAGSMCDIARSDVLNHRLEVTGGVQAAESAALLQEFFQARR
ncbi:MAG: tRNA adenosine(34) deaminase TadA [Gammaproteobacteria bacterium]|nr:tRNA adenosine(34) deaminase TadA [Gammaproteobacteria bacterium]